MEKSDYHKFRPGLENLPLILLYTAYDLALLLVFMTQFSKKHNKKEQIKGSYRYHYMTHS